MAVKGIFGAMENKVATLKAELAAIELWDRLFIETPEPNQIDKDAAKARFFRSVQIVHELIKLENTGRIQ